MLDYYRISWCMGLLFRMQSAVLSMMELQMLTKSDSAPDMLQITYDLYKPYVAKHASGKHLLWISRLMVALFGLVMACVSVIFYKVYTSPGSLICMMASGLSTQLNKG